MKQNTVVWSLCLALLASSAAWAAPKAARRSAARPAAVSEIMVYKDGGGFGGRNAGSGEGWTLRANGTAVHSVDLSPAQMDAAGEAEVPDVFGDFTRSDFEGLAQYIQSSRLLSLKVPPAPDDGSGSLRIDVVRGGKRRSVFLRDSAPPSPASAAGWVALTLVRGIVADTDWKDKAGHPISTGLDGNFVRTASGLTPDESYRADPSPFSVRSAAGKEVGTVQDKSESGYFHLVLPPGAYRLTPKPAGGAGDASHSAPNGYAWQVSPSTVQVRPGRMSPVIISLQKTPPAP